MFRSDFLESFLKLLQWFYELFGGPSIHAENSAKCHQNLDTDQQNQKIIAIPDKHFLCYLGVVAGIVGKLPHDED